MTTVTVEGCRCCQDRNGPHTYEHDLVAMRNVIGGAIFKNEATTALERLHAAFTERDTEIAALRTENAEMSKVTGPKCPKCERYLRVGHRQVWVNGVGNVFVGNTDRLPSYCISSDELVASYPDIVADMSLTEVAT